MKALDALTRSGSLSSKPGEQMAQRRAVGVARARFALLHCFHENFAREPRSERSIIPLRVFTSHLAAMPFFSLRPSASGVFSSADTVSSLIVDLHRRVCGITRFSSSCDFMYKCELFISELLQLVKKRKNKFEI